MRIVIEAGARHPWVSRELKRQGHKVTVAKNARKVATSSRTNASPDSTTEKSIRELSEPIQPVR
jgi:transposase